MPLTTLGVYLPQIVKEQSHNCNGFRAIDRKIVRKAAKRPGFARLKAHDRVVRNATSLRYYVEVSTLPSKKTGRSCRVGR